MPAPTARRREHLGNIGLTDRRTTTRQTQGLSGGPEAFSGADAMQSPFLSGFASRVVRTT